MSDPVELPHDDPAMFAMIREALYTPVIGDILDSLGHQHQFLPPEVRPLTPDMVVVGRAMPVLMEDVRGPQAAPFGRAHGSGGPTRARRCLPARTGATPQRHGASCSLAAARVSGATGAVIDGYHRDTDQVLEADWPVFSHGGYAWDLAGRAAVVDYRVTAVIGGVTVQPGDLVFGDRRGWRRHRSGRGRT